MKSNNTQHKNSGVKKVSKKYGKPKSETVTISLKKRESTVNKHQDTSYDIKSIARKLKSNLSVAAQFMNNNASTSSSSSNVQSTLSTPDWPKNKPVLHNLQLLKQYLTFVSQESHTQITLDDDKHSIQFNFSNKQKLHEPIEKHELDGRLGATLIESMVHNTPTLNELRPVPYSANRTTIDRRRPGRPPKPKSTSDKDINIKNTSLRKKKRDSISCICDSPHEEFGAMVQCDDCSSWLHLDCLELNDEALEGTFRCPPCFLSLGNSNMDFKLTSSLTWRFAAQWKSRRIAAIDNDECTSDEDDDEDDTMTDTTISNHGNYQINTDLMDYEIDYYYNTNNHIKSTFNYNTMEEITPAESVDHNNTDHNKQNGDPTNYSSEGLVDWTDGSSESRFSSSQHSDDSPSEASTPDEHLYSSDPFENQDNIADMLLSPGNLELLSRLAYLHSLESNQHELIAPNASDVFLCENFSKNSLYLPSSPQIPRLSIESPPSDICPQLLSEFCFDSGPFWEPLL
ncbi:hypothetical protein BDB01DRAFT_781596 [Pilobolus umbonatus]|nr:hypothetical protein BDB01DRAFT_781596 [Pilobolus umbonatus]